jgi:hypothetical protein
MMSVGQLMKIVNEASGSDGTILDSTLVCEITFQNGNRVKFCPDAITFQQVHDVRDRTPPKNQAVLSFDRRSG